MPNLDLLIGNNAINLSATAFANPAIAHFSPAQLTLVRDVLSAISGAPISSLGNNPIKAEFTASHELNWDFDFGAGAALQVKFAPSVVASIEIRQQGELFAFEGDLDLEEDLPLGPPAAPRVTPGMAYVSIRLKVTLDASGAFGFTHGLFGIKANAGTGQQFLLAYHHQVPQTHTVSNAVVDAFQHFVFPYSAAGAGALQQGCFAEWEYIGKYDVGFTFSAGFGGSLLGARGASALGRSLSSPVGQAAIGLKPTFQLGAALNVAYSHEDAFRNVLSASDANHAELFIYKMNRSNLRIGVGLNAGVQLHARVKLETRLEDITKDAIEKLVPAALPGRDALIQKLLGTLPAGDLDKATAELEEKINDFLANLDKLSISASIRSERIREHQALFSYRFDRTGGLGVAGFTAAMEGRLKDALASPGVSLSTGSFVRDTVIRRTTMRLQLLGTFEARSIDEYIQFGEMVYDGDGVFRLRFTRARRSESNVFGHRKQIEILFTATAKSFLSGQVRDADVRLRFTITDTNNENAARRTASALAMIVEGTPNTQMARRMREAIAENSAIETKITCSIAPSAFRKLTFTAFESAGRAKRLPHANDAANYVAFVDAVNTLFPDHLQGEGFPDRAERFSDWAQFNVAVNSGPSTQLNENSRPNRRDRGNPAFPGNWPQFGQLAGITDTARMQFIFVCLEAARFFMNSCEDLVVLAGDLDRAQTDAAFDRLIEDMGELAKGQLSGSFPLFFGKATLVALLARMVGAAVEVEGPAESAGPLSQFAVRLDVK